MNTVNTNQQSVCNTFCNRTTLILDIYTCNITRKIIITIKQCTNRETRCNKIFVWQGQNPVEIPHEHVAAYGKYLMRRKQLLVRCCSFTGEVYEFAGWDLYRPSMFINDRRHVLMLWFNVVNSKLWYACGTWSSNSSMKLSTKSWHIKVSSH